MRDARLYQIACLGALLAFGATTGAIGATPGRVAAALAGALGAQLLFSRSFGVRFEIRSALITTLSLSLLLRTGDPAWMAAAGALAIGSKFLLRTETGHVFNPANFAIVTLAAVSDAVWTSPGQWGTSVIFAAVFAGLGAATTARAGRLDTPFIFLGAYAALVLGRAAVLGDPMAIPLHALQNGALIVFAFFMISDPKTTPDDRLARYVYVASVAALAYALQYHLFDPDGIFHALFIASIARPLIDAARPAARFRWPSEFPARPHERPAE
ncbi:MAG: RnfABCDGE type electron transport complex subunit D [Pseudomonadota bacterium]